MKETYISTLSQYIEYIEKLKSYYPSNVLFNNPVSNSFLYRGISNISYKLLPSVYRKTVYEFEGRKITNDKYLAWSSEISLLQSFIHEASGCLSIPANELLRWAEYAQHYGVPTRFLDWSRNPLVALYFACKDNTEKNGSVWLLHANNYKRFWAEHVNVSDTLTIKEIITDMLNNDQDVEYPMLYTPYYVDARMSAQKSFFLVWGKKKEAFEDLLASEQLFMDLPEIDNGSRVYGKAQQTDSLFRFLIHADRKQPLLHELDMVGVNEKTLFPGLDGIGRYIERQYRFDYNEAVENI